MNQDTVRSQLHYNPETGELTWRIYKGKMKPGDRFGSPTSQGYLRGCLDGKMYLAHRLAFLYMKGYFPVAGLDHDNGVKSDNRWNNLKEANQTVNMQNLRRARVDSSTGLLGVSPHRGRFVARIKHDGRYKSLGVFDTPEEASAAYKAAKAKFHGVPYES